MSLKQRKTKFKPKIKLIHNMAIIVPLIYRERKGFSDVFFTSIHDFLHNEISDKIHIVLHKTVFFDRLSCLCLLACLID